jgi:hypothetical protein
MWKSASMSGLPGRPVTGRRADNSGLVTEIATLYNTGTSRPVSGKACRCPVLLAAVSGLVVLKGNIDPIQGDSDSANGSPEV